MRLPLLEYLVKIGLGVIAVLPENLKKFHPFIGKKYLEASADAHETEVKMESDTEDVQTLCMTVLMNS